MGVAVIGVFRWRCRKVPTGPHSGTVRIPYRFIGLGATGASEPFKVIGLGAVYGAQPFRFKVFRAVDLAGSYNLYWVALLDL